MTIDEIEAGDVLWHKATEKKLVVSEVQESQVRVTNEDDEVKYYKPAELRYSNPIPSGFC